MDGVSAAASVIAVLQISGQVYSLCRTYYLGVKDARRDIQRLREEVSSLEEVLTKVVDLADVPNPNELAIFKLLNQAEGPVQQCQAQLTDINARLAHGQGKDKMKHFGLRALKWPFSSKEVDSCLLILGRHKATFELALTADHVGLSRVIKDEVARVNEKVSEIQSGQDTFLADVRRQKIHRWLLAPDPFSNHNAAHKKQQVTTGAWFVNGAQFAEWESSPHSFLWLHGIPGCGKTILCSTIIHNVMLHCQPDPTSAIGIFYFDFNDIEKENPNKMIRSLITQFSIKSTNIPIALNTLYSHSSNGQQQPTTDALMSTLQDMLQDFHQVFIILDALDECADREELMQLIDDFVGWKDDKLHLLATSRRETDITDAFRPLTTGQISIQNEIVNADIQTYVGEKLRNDPKLKTWSPEVRMEIEATLMDGAHGMFRWVVCQLDELRKCLKLDVLRRVLKSLPKTLDDTYARILCNIDEQHSQDAFKILRWLACSARPVKIVEVAEVVAIHVGGNPSVDPDSRFREPHDVLTVCSSLVTTAASNVRSDYWPNDSTEELRLAHYSVKEYLISDRIRVGRASRYSVTDSANDYIAESCLTYLLHLNKPNLHPSDIIEEYPLAGYAAQYWARHAQQACNNSDVTRVQQLCMEFFLHAEEAHLNCIRLFDPEKPWRKHGKVIYRISPLYHASLVGLYVIVQQLLEKGADVNVQGGTFGNALQVASYRGHDSIVQQLLEKGADVNALGEGFSTALQVASYCGHESIVQQLLEKGADVNVQNGYFGNALQAASFRGHNSTVEQLLERGVDVNTQRGYYGNALQAASYGGHNSIVQQLLTKGADVNARGGKYESALRAATLKGHGGTVQLLLKWGAHQPEDCTDSD